MNRQERRKLERAQDKKLEKLEAEKKNQLMSLFRHGISKEDLKKEYDAGWQDGYAQGKTDEMICIFGAFLIALRKQKDRWGTKRALRVLNQAFKECSAFVDEQDAVDKVYADLNIVFRFGEPFDPFEEGEKK